MKNQFNVGDPVKAVSFIDCFGKVVPEVSGLTVETVTEHARMGLPPYYRVKAVTPNGLGYVEGAESYFTMEVSK